MDDFSRLDSVEDAVAAISRGGAVVVVDDEDRENEGDLIFPAATATTEQLAFAIRHSTGIICAPMAGQELDRLGKRVQNANKATREWLESQN